MFRLTQAELKVFSAIFSNLVVVWLVAISTTQDVNLLTRDMLAVILSLYLATKAEKASKESK